MFRFRFCQRNLNAAKLIDDIDKGIEIHLRISIHTDAEAVCYRLIEELDSPKGIGRIQFPAPMSRNLHVHVPHQGCDLELIVFHIQRSDHHGI